MAGDVQVDVTHYEWSYQDKGRWISYWHQVDEVLALEAKTCLEIGVGSGVVKRTLEAFGVTVTAMDIDPGLGVDRVGDLREIPADDGEFDVVLCAQVLEHIPWEDVPQALRELRRVCRTGAVISIPQSGRSLSLGLDLLSVASLRRGMRLPSRQPHAFDGQHYWQQNARGQSRAQVRQVLEAAGFAVAKSYTVPEHTFHHFYVLRRD